MRAFVTALAIGLSLAAWATPGRTQSDRDFLFKDEHGHLIIRFTATATEGLSSAQAYEILNAEFSSMVHDRLHADLKFGEEPPDPGWARSIEPQIEQHVRRAGPEFSNVFVECRAVSCRVILEQPVHWPNPDEHQLVLESVQASIESFIGPRDEVFDPALMITAYYQENEISHIKVFLRRAGYQPEESTW